MKTAFFWGQNFQSAISQAVQIGNPKLKVLKKNHSSHTCFINLRVKNYGKSDKPVEFIVSCAALTGCQQNGAAIWRVEEMTFSLLQIVIKFSVLYKPPDGFYNPFRGCSILTENTDLYSKLHSLLIAGKNYCFVYMYTYSG